MFILFGVVYRVLGRPAVVAFGGRELTYCKLYQQVSLGGASKFMLADSKRSLLK